MKNAVIDIGSNSVRLMLIADGVTLYKQVETTRLGEGLAASGVLKREAMERTAQAVQKFCTVAAGECAKVFAFATEAVRAAGNGGEFVKLVADTAGVSVHVLEGIDEAAVGYLGATMGRRCGASCVIDIGGASTELAAGENGALTFTRSLPVGVVRIYDTCGENVALVKKYIAGILAGCSVPAKTETCFGIGGTITNLAAALYGIVPYRAELVHGKTMNAAQLTALSDKLYRATIDERIAMGIEPKRADLICGGATLLISVMERCGIQTVTASESDNLEGYWLRFCQY